MNSLFPSGIPLDPPHKPAGRKSSRVLLFFIIIALVAALACAVARWKSRPGKVDAVCLQIIRPELRKVSGTPPAEARNCVQCHATEVAEWKDSEHANANRLFVPLKDMAAFQTSALFTADGRKTIVHSDHGIATIDVTKADGARVDYHPAAVIGARTVVQYLIPFSGGRLQTLNISFDPQKKEWFDFQAPDTRMPNDWSHWQNRGLNWNSQCAFCHMTNLRKGYDAPSDAYRTTWDAMGISCAQCHGPMESHAAHPNDRALFNPLTVKQTIENCGACHSRREELDGNFHVGDALLDHYRISLPEQAGLYYPDGQVKDEDFEYGSFLMSRMGQKGITCLDCHNPHSGRLLAPVENNALCMTCHTPPGQRGAIPVDLATHTHHQPGTPGDRCVDCHMPVTTYMGRDPRRDHGFTIPDPVLTKELGVPNSCNRCHADQTADWAIEFTSKWYGDKMKRRSRERALLISRAEKHDGSAVPELVSMAKSEDNSAWRAVIASDLTPWASQEEVRGYLEKSLSDESPLVRSAAVRALSNEPGTAAILKPLCDDAVRLVRLDAAWGMHDTRDRSRPSYKELIAYLDTISDQPAGALRKTQLALDEQRMDDALEWSAKASAWDATSGGAHQVHALVLNAAGKPNEAIQELRRASDLEPKNAQYPFMLALLYGGEGQTDDVIGQLKKAISIDPAFGRAWYNLGLALAKQGQLTESIAALRRAETLLPDTPEIPYARATVHARAGQLEEARDAATRAQALGYSPAAELLRRLFPPGSGSPANR